MVNGVTQTISIPSYFVVQHLVEVFYSEFNDLVFEKLMGRFCYGSLYLTGT